MTTIDHVIACGIVRTFKTSDGFTTVYQATCVCGKTASLVDSPTPIVLTNADFAEGETRYCSCQCGKTLPERAHKSRKFLTDACMVRSWRARKAEAVSA